MLDRNFISKFILNDAAFAPSHGATNGYLGTGMIYYALVYALRAPLAVCLGSGDGFVPRLLRQAQIDAGVAATSETILIDANMPEAGWGSPDYFERPDCTFRQCFDVNIMNMTTAAGFYAIQDRHIDYLHIDADHSYEHVEEDFRLYSQLLTDVSVVTLHDSNGVWSRGGVPQLVGELRDGSKFDVVDFNDLWHGVAIVRRNSLETRR